MLVPDAGLRRRIGGADRPEPVGPVRKPGGAASSGYTVNSLFTGAGPRVGIKGQFGIGDFQFIGEMAGAS